MKNQRRAAFRSQFALCGLAIALKRPASNERTFCGPSLWHFAPAREALSPCSDMALRFFFGMSPLQEDDVLRRLDGRIVNPAKRREEETVFVDISSDKEDQVTPAGIIAVRVLTDEHTLLIADALCNQRDPRS